MLEKFKKRTKEQIEASEANKDFTDGYEFFPWLIHMRLWHFIPTVGLLAFGVGMFIFTEDSYDTTFQFWAAVVACAAHVFLMYMLRRDYKLLQKGISS